jgi:hypothetical protein
VNACPNPQNRGKLKRNQNRIVQELGVARWSGASRRCLRVSTGPCKAETEVAKT